MKIILRQGLKYSLVGYFGYFIGILSAIFLYPNDEAFYGSIRTTLSYAELICPIVLLGFSSVVVKFFNEYKNRNQTKTLLFHAISMVIINSVIVVLVIWGMTYLFPQIQETVFWRLKTYIIPLFVVYALLMLFTRYVSNYKRIVIPSIFNNLFLKLAAIVSFVAFVFYHFSESISLSIFVVCIALGLLGLVFYTLQLEPIQGKPTFIKDQQIWSFALFSTLGTLGSFIAFRVDNIVIVEYFNEQTVGLYAILFSVVSIILIPKMALYSIAMPIVSDLFHKSEMQKLNTLYQQSNFYSLLLGSVIVSLLLSGAYPVFSLMKNHEMMLYLMPVFYVLCITQLIDISFGFNNEIIAMSPFYKYSIYAIVCLIFVTIGLNLFFIYYTDLGLMGVALSTAISIILYNIIKNVIIYNKMKINGFTKRMLAVVIVCLGSIVMIGFVPKNINPWLGMIVYPTAVLLYYYMANLVCKFINLKTIFKHKPIDFLMGKEQPNM